MKSVDKTLSSVDFSKYSQLEFKSTFDEGVLFPLDLKVATLQHHCPYCLRTLYAMRNRSLYYCKAKTHKRFIIGADKLRF